MNRFEQCRLPVLGMLLMVLALSACVSHQQYRTDYKSCMAIGEDCSASAWQKHHNKDGTEYSLAFIEFDDQGLLWHRSQMETVETRIAELASSGDLLMVVFVHGWKHDAAHDDPNIKTFRSALANLASAEGRISTLGGSKPRQLVGVYLGWRGDSISLPVLKQLTFWDRKKTAQQVGHGGVTEVLSRLELIKRTKDVLAGGRSNTRLIVVGHSFGGAVVFTALGQLLVNRFVHTTGPTGVASDIEGFGDLVVLINPAFEALLFTPLSDLSIGRGSYFASQLPRIAVLTGEADDATRTAFPIGRWFSTVLEHDTLMHRRNAVTGEVEVIDGGAAARTAVGHFEPYRTHRLLPLDQRQDEELQVRETEKAVSSFLRTSRAWRDDSPGSRIEFSTSVLVRSDDSAGRNPYLVVYVDGDIIRHHNDINSARLIQFVEDLILISSQSEEQLERTLRDDDAVSSGDAS